MFAQEEEIRRGGPEDWTGPVAHQGEKADTKDVEATHAVVRTGEVDRRDRVGASEGEEGHVLEEDGGRGDFCDGGVGRLEKLEDDLGEEEEGYVGGSRLRHSEYAI